MTLETGNSRSEDSGDFARRLGERLYVSRYVLAAAVFLAILLSADGVVSIWQVLGGITVLAVAALVPAQASTVVRRERQLKRDARMRLETIVFNTCEALEDPAFILSEGGIVKYQNRAAVEKFGSVSADAHLSSRLRAPEILQMVDQAMAQKREATIAYTETVPSERWFRVRIAPMKEVSAIAGGSELYLLMLRDQSESKRTDRMRTDFIANASHELRTPLASLSGFIETMQGPARNDAEAREQFLGIMQEQAGRMTRLLDDLLSLSRLEMSAHITPTEEVDLTPLMTHVCDSLRPLAEDLGVEIKMADQSTPFVVKGDRDELIQVFENLVENACKYGQSGKKVEITMRPEEGAGEVSVRDFGPGIPKEHVPRLTERFYRVNVEASRSKKGTGLGLAIVKHILTRHRARLVVRSEPGAGSEFVVKFDGPTR